MKRFFLAALVLSLAVQAEAEVKLPALLGSNMVLQRNTEVNFWGEASPRSRVRVTVSQCQFPAFTLVCNAER